MTRADPLARQIEHFGRVVRGEAEPIVSARDGLQNLRITEAIVAAAKSGSLNLCAAEKGRDGETMK
jgi:predicted dehydrogenase